jgi:tripartite-type tricarboxylate transporter receptor subunit TctC
VTVKTPRWIAAFIIAPIVVTAAGAFTSAAAFPERTITIIVPYTPGGSTDLMARLLGQRLSTLWGHPVVIANQPGAGGSIGAARAAKSPADGYTWFMTTNSPITTNLALYSGLGYDTLHDFEPVVMVADSPMLLVTHSNLPVTSVKDIITLAKNSPVNILAGISGNGATTHLAITEFSRLSGAPFTIVAYRGGVPMNTAMLSGDEIQLGFNDIVPLLPLVRDGKLRAIATPQLHRAAAAPDVPTLDETGMPGFNVTPWTAILLPKGVPGDIVKLINTEVNRIFNEPTFKERIISIGQDSVAPNTPEQFAVFLRSEIPRWREMVRGSGVEITGMPAQ